MAEARCPCGYTKFAERIDRRRETAERWRRVGGGGGFGATPFGLFFGTGSPPDSWGRFVVPIVTGTRNMVCLSCARVRRGVPVGGGVSMSAWVEGSYLFAIMTDVVDPGCVQVRFSLAGGPTYERSVESEAIDAADAPARPGAALELREELPSGAALPTYAYRIEVPEVEEAGLYRVMLIDRCLGTVQRLLELELAPPPAPPPTLPPVWEA
jgi:hypothetical protein